MIIKHSYYFVVSRKSKNIFSLSTDWAD